MIDLTQIPPAPPEGMTKSGTKADTKKLIKELTALQRVLFAQSQYSVLLVLQGLDASGKDGAIRNVFRGVNPLGVRVIPFKKPTSIEFAHDYLWRIHQHTPENGMIHIFNRSHYEDILVPSVEGYIDKKTIDKRYGQINDFERHLTENNTVILKFYLHISREEQTERLKERISHREKNWKHNDGDWAVSKKWNDYQDVYESIFEKCNEIPWHIVSANSNWFKEYTIIKTLVEALKKLNLEWPELETEIF